MNYQTYQPTTEQWVNEEYNQIWSRTMHIFSVTIKFNFIVHDELNYEFIIYQHANHSASLVSNQCFVLLGKWQLNTILLTSTYIAFFYSFILLHFAFSASLAWTTVKLSEKSAQTADHISIMYDVYTVMKKPKFTHTYTKWNDKNNTNKRWETLSLYHKRKLNISSYLCLG